MFSYVPWGSSPTDENGPIPDPVTTPLSLGIFYSKILVDPRPSPVGVDGPTQPEKTQNPGKGIHLCFWQERTRGARRRGRPRDMEVPVDPSLSVQLRTCPLNPLWFGHLKSLVLRGGGTSDGLDSTRSWRVSHFPKNVPVWGVLSLVVRGRCQRRPDPLPPLSR